MSKTTKQTLTRRDRQIIGIALSDVVASFWTNEFRSELIDQSLHSLELEIKAVWEKIDTKLDLDFPLLKPQERNGLPF